MKLVLKTLTAALIALPLAPAAVEAAPPARHGHSAMTPPHVDGFDIEQVNQLTPGTDLNFKLYGTPGAVVTVGMAGSARRLALEETQLGVYEGTYTVSTRDRLTPYSAVTANLRLGNQVATAVLDESLVAGATQPAQQSAVGPARIDAFEMGPVTTMASGSELTFYARGTPGGQASVTIPGARKVLLQETSPGYYRGNYIIRSSDRIDTQSPTVARLRVGDQVATSTLGQSFGGATTAMETQSRAYSPPLAQANQRPLPRPAPVVCSNCATVIAVNPVEVNGAGSYVGPVAGGVVGAIIGSQIGGGNGRTLGGVAGAVGGALAGREIERRVGKTTHYEVVARLNNGGQQTFSYETDPGLAVGTRVRIEGDRLVRERESDRLLSRDR